MFFKFAKRDCFGIAGEKPKNPGVRGNGGRHFWVFRLVNIILIIRSSLDIDVMQLTGTWITTSTNKCFQHLDIMV